MQNNASVVSVIVPVYNAEQTLRRCLDSILGQSYEHLEVLLVDDGSTDGSLTLLREYERSDSRVRVFSVPNGGVSAARNLAIDHATGEYIQFVDSDDNLFAGATMNLITAMKDQSCELTIAPYIEVVGNMQKPCGRLQSDEVLDQAGFLDHLSAHPNSFYYAVLWNKLYRRDIICEQGIRCDQRFPWGEDFAFNAYYYRYVKRVAVISKPVYQYRRSPDGLAMSTAKDTLRHPVDSIGVKKELYELYKQLFESVGLYEKYKRVLPQYLFKVTISG
ncbi:MAG: glycosyltransferase [Clostridiales bacterium]|nr:glycosyltransferase [Clostridiales bacterium]